MDGRELGDLPFPGLALAADRQLRLRLGGQAMSHPPAAHNGRPSEDLDGPFARVVTLAEASGLPEVSLGTSYGTPALLVKGKSFARMKDADTLVVMCALEEKEMLLELDPSLFFETDHYKGWPAMLVRLGAIDDASLTQRLIAAWREKAPRKLSADFPA
ncbi:MmcQ/YjbR family DNA-binding protein [Ensifer canadensis]